MTKINGSAGRLKGIIVLILLFGPASFLIFISSRGCEHKFVELDDMGKVSNYNFVNADGTQMNQATFKNKVVLFTTLQVTCPNKCAVSFWHLDQLIYQHLRKNKKKLGHVKLVSFVTDSKGNPYSNLNDVEFMLKDQVEKYDSSVWILANGDAKSLYNISRNGENLLMKGNQYFGGEAFQELMLLVDKRNHLRMVLKGNSEGMIRKMKEHIALLDKQYDKEAFKHK
jgi:cytochrome oxidase Cu insertion factor (SCO1/SenC/PrrC family)